MKQHAPITIIIPTYQRLDYFKIALQSCLQQTVLPQAIIIGDDSKDNLTEEWVKVEQANWPFKIQYRHNQPGLGQADNVESLLQMVTTEYMLLLHDDDALQPEAIEILYKAMSQTDADVVFGKQLIIDENGIIDNQASNDLNKAYRRSKVYEGKKLNAMEVALTQQLPSNSFLLKSELAKTIHYNYQNEAGDAVDFHFCLKLAERNAVFKYIDVYVSQYRISPTSVSKGGNMAYYTYSLTKQLEVSKELESLKSNFLKTNAPMAIPIAIRMNKKKEAFRIYFSKDHRSKIFTAGGLKRFLMLTSIIKA